nr:hypothetical protein [Lachnospiraceae bacterium]
MSDTYVELLIKRKNSPMGKALRAACIFMGITQILLYVLSKGFFFVGTALLFFGIAYFSNFVFRVEYEYLLVDRQLSVDKIMNRSKRKKVAEYDLSTELEMFAPLGSPHLDYYKDMVSAERDFTSGTGESTVFGLVVHVEKTLELVKMEANDELLEQISMISPRKVFKD